MAVQETSVTAALESLFAGTAALPRVSRLARLTAPEISVVVPTRNERDNVSALIDRLERSCGDLALEVVFVDDSADGTADVIRERARCCPHSVRLIHRRPEQRRGGLGGAVLAGLIAARSDSICVMDADLQHPPELIGALVERARSSKADVVVASRHCRGGDIGDFSPLRRAFSRASVLLARTMFPCRLGGLSDPLSGFFLVQRGAFDLAALRPRGFKILLEILLCDRRLQSCDVPFRFGERYAGESKASLREGLRYVRRLVELRVACRQHSGRVSGSGADLSPSQARHGAQLRTGQRLG